MAVTHVYEDGFEAGLSTYKATQEMGVYLAPTPIGPITIISKAWDDWHLGYERGWSMGRQLHRRAVEVERARKLHQHCGSNGCEVTGGYCFMQQATR